MHTTQIFSEVLERSARRREERRNFLRVAGSAAAAVGGASLLAACGDDNNNNGGMTGATPTPSPTSPPSTAITDLDILNFALNLGVSRGAVLFLCRNR